MDGWHDRQEDCEVFKSYGGLSTEKYLNQQTKKEERMSCELYERGLARPLEEQVGRLKQLRTLLGATLQRIKQLEESGADQTEISREHSLAESVREELRCQERQVLASELGLE